MAKPWKYNPFGSVRPSAYTPRPHPIWKPFNKNGGVIFDGHSSIFSKKKERSETKRRRLEWGG